MTIDIDAIEARANAATPGPWHCDSDGNITQTAHVTRDVWFIPMNVEDSQFAAAARTDVPALIARVRELEAENSLLQHALKASAKRAEDINESLRRAGVNNYSPHQHRCIDALRERLAEAEALLDEANVVGIGIGTGEKIDAFLRGAK